VVNGIIHINEVTQARLVLGWVPFADILSWYLTKPPRSTVYSAWPSFRVGAMNTGDSLGLDEIRPLTGLTENAERENNGPSKSRGVAPGDLNQS